MDASVITPLNLNKICRICLIESNEMHSIFSVLQSDGNEKDLTYVYEILMTISSIKMSTDQMPTTLCTACLELANTSYKFQQQCNRSQIILETYLTQLNRNDVNESDLLNITNDKGLSNITSIDNFDISKEHMNLVGMKLTDIKTEENHMIDEFNESLNIEINKVKIADVENLNTCKIATLENVKLKRKIALNQRQILESNGYKSQRENLNYYIKTTDQGSKVYACNLCEKTYKYGSSLKVHRRSHTLERPYICKLCGKDFKQYGSLTHHLRSHSGEQPYICKLCGKKYKQSGSLKTHMRVHTGQRPFLCSICGRGFRQAPDLGYHMRTHTKEKPYMCNICGKTMSMQCHLVQHMRTHTGERPFKCTECDKAFPSTTRLKRHAIIHTGLKPYKCEVCDRSFNRKSSLRVHAKIHTDDRPHVCSVCGKAFIQPHSLKSHIITHYSTTSDIKVF